MGTLFDTGPDLYQRDSPRAKLRTIKIFSPPVAKCTTSVFVLSYVSAMDYKMLQIDVKAEFPDGTFRGEI